MRWYTFGDPLGRRPKGTEHGAAAAEFERLTALETDDCVEWPLGKTAKGYGAIVIDGKQKKVHHLALLRRKPPPFESARALHQPVICHNPPCMNYRHLYWGSDKDNALDRRLDGTEIRQYYPRPLKTHCPRGHPYDATNTRVDRNGSRHCRICDRRSAREAYYRARRDMPSR